MIIVIKSSNALHLLQINLTNSAVLTVKNFTFILVVGIPFHYPVNIVEPPFSVKYHKFVYSKTIFAPPNVVMIGLYLSKVNQLTLAGEVVIPDINGVDLAGSVNPVKQEQEINILANFVALRKRNWGDALMFII